MTDGRPARPAVPGFAHLRKWSRAPFASLPMRIGVVLVVSACPALLLMIVRHGAGHEAVGALLFGLALAWFGIEFVVARPLRALRLAVDQWRSGQPFLLPSNLALSVELRALGLSFKRATRTLSYREWQLGVAIQQQELAMQEIHHRVKNNLQIVASLLNLQATRIRLPEAQAEFQSARDRVRALATVHRHLYAHGQVHTINMRGFLLELCEQLFHAMGETVDDRLVLHVDAPELEMSSDQAVPLSLIVTEAVTNAIKYAYPAGRRGTISVRLRDEGETALLEICDDGIGIPAGRAETDSGTRDGIGIQLITGFARQLGARLDVEQGTGTRYAVRIKLRHERVDSPMLRARPNSPAFRAAASPALHATRDEALPKG